MTAEAIGRVVADLQANRVRLINDRSRLPHVALDAVIDPTVVDCTGIYQSLVAKDEPVFMYEDHPSIAPPFDEAAFAYVNEHGNVIVMHVFDVPDDAWDNTAEPVNWADDVRWRLQVLLWVGGQSRVGAFGTTGPAHMWKFAVGHDGAPLDIRWVRLVDEYPMERWDMAALVVLGALNFLNCVNVEVAEPVRPRAERRRVARTGVTVNEIVVSGLSKTSTRRSSSGSEAVPLTSVRGHFAQYGPKYDRGLLFGKYEGRYWIPQHARGSADVGETQHTYTIDTEGTA